MKIPIIDSLIDRMLRSKPQKTKAFIDLSLMIKKGDKSAVVDIPCSLFIQDFQLTFPSGIKYVYGDSETEEESPEVVHRTCPSVGVSLPDVADKDTEIPLRIGFAENPKKHVTAILYNILALLGFLTFSLFTMAFFSVLGGLALFVVTIIGLTLQLRLYLRVDAFWKNVTVIEKEEKP
jgi:hypothetical protein